MEPSEMHTRIIRFLFFFIVLASGTSLARAQGVIVPGPCQRCPEFPRPGFAAFASNKINQDRRQNQFAVCDNTR